MVEAEKNQEESKLKQPRIFVIDKEIDNLIFYVVVTGRKFFAKNICDAVEIAMFFFLGINIQYPCECEIVWEFLQQQIFDVPSTTKQQSSQLRELIKKLGKK